MEFLTDQNFEKKTLGNQKPAVVAFMTPTCPNCARLAPIFEAVAEDNADTADFFKLNAHDYLNVAKKFKVMVVPTLLYFRHGFLVEKRSGVQSKNKIEETINQIIDYSPAGAQTHQYKNFFQKLFGR
jgi:thioredoxin 1